MTTYDHQALLGEGIEIVSAVNKISAYEKKKPFALVGDPKSKEVGSCWGFGKQLRGIVGDQQVTT